MICANPAGTSSPKRVCRSNSLCRVNSFTAVGVPRHALLARVVRISCLAFVTLCAQSSFGQAIDSVDVERIGNEAEISIRFITQIQYLRHAPPDSGKSLRIYLRFTGPGIEESDLIVPNTIRPSKTGYLGSFSVFFPEPDRALLIAFDQSTRYTVRPKPDGRSISIRVPILPGS